MSSQIWPPHADPNVKNNHDVNDESMEWMHQRQAAIKAQRTSWLQSAVCQQSPSQTNAHNIKKKQVTTAKANTKIRPRNKKQHAAIVTNNSKELFFPPALNITSSIQCSSSVVDECQCQTSVAMLALAGPRATRPGGRRNQKLNRQRDVPRTHNSTGI